MNDVPTSRAGALVDLNADRVATAVGGYHAEFFSWGYFPARPWRNYLHSHSYFEACYAFAGRGTFRIRGQEHEVAAGQVFLARPGEEHEIRAEGPDPLGIYFWAHTLRADAGGGSQLLTALADATGPVRSSRVGAIPTLLGLLDQEAAAAAAGREESVAALAGALTVATARALLDPAVLLPVAVLPGADTVVGRRGAAAARAMIRYLHDNYQREVVVRDVAAQVHLSERHAGRLFRRATGVGIGGYLLRLRLDVAASRLAEREPSVKEVAHCCGYPDVRHFTTAFRRRFGVTPAAFRAQRATRFVGAAARHTGRVWPATGSSDRPGPGGSATMSHAEKRISNR